MSGKGTQLQGRIPAIEFSEQVPSGGTSRVILLEEEKQRRFQNLVIGIYGPGGSFDAVFEFTTSPFQNVKEDIGVVWRQYDFTTDSVGNANNITEDLLVTMVAQPTAIRVRSISGALTFEGTGQGVA